MRIICVILLLSLFSACQSTSDISKEYAESPCDDAQYLILKKMKVSEMNSGQIEYLNIKEAECERYKLTHSKEKLAKKEADSNLILILSVAGAAIAIGVIIAILLGGGSIHW